MVETQLKRASGPSPIAEANRYGLFRWEGLCRYLDDGCIENDTNAATAVSATSDYSFAIKYEYLSTNAVIQSQNCDISSSIISIFRAMKPLLAI